MKIESLLLHGEENAISTQELLSLTKIQSARCLQKQIEQERARGALILSASDGGYFLPDDGEKGYRELSAFVRTLRSRAVNTLRTLKAANKALQRMDGAQVEMMEGFCEPNERDTDQ